MCVVTSVGLTDDSPFNRKTVLAEPERSLFYVKEVFQFPFHVLHIPASGFFPEVAGFGLEKQKEQTTVGSISEVWKK